MAHGESWKTIVSRLWRPIIGIIALAVIIAWTGGFFESKVPPGKIEHKEGQPLADKAELYTIIKEQFAPKIDVVGTVASEETIYLSSRIPSYIKNIFASAGDAVEKGQVLITLDDREIKEQLSAAESQFRQAEIEYKRTKSLFEKTAATEQALVAAESLYTSLRARVEQVRVMLTYTKIISPIRGIVTDRRVEIGDLANPGQVLLSVYDPLRMRLEAAVPVRLIDKLTVNQNVEATIERPDKTFEGTVTGIVSEVDPTTRTQMVKVRLNTLSENILPGVFGRLWIEEDPRPGIVIPASAVYRVGQLEMVLVVEENRAIRRMVTTGLRLGQRVEVLSGLKEKEIIVVHPQIRG
jgi:membrane fusion protein (multidrug efflux system)